MPTIDYSGRFHVRAYSTKKNSTGAIGFPVKASRLSTAIRFAEKMVLKLLPGWDIGRVYLARNKKAVSTWVLRRPRDAAREEEALAIAREKEDNA